MKTPASQMFGEAMGRVLAKGGTPEGARRGWETRRRGGPPLIPVVRHFSDARDKIKSLIRESVDELEQEIENNRKRIPSDYMGMIRRDEARRRQGYELVREAAQRLAGIQPHPGDAEKRAMLLRYAEQEAERVSQRDGEKSWDEEFSDYLTAAGEIAERATSQVH
jgi:hypothetical protein